VSFIRPDIILPHDANMLCERVMEASPRDVITYHRGELARDRDRYASELPEDRRLELDAMASYAWRLAEAGWCYLLQRREISGCFLYLLVVRPRPHQRPASLPRPQTLRRSPLMQSASLMEAA
jgi:hypothetical protein